MIINWKTFGESWAFLNLFKHFSTALPKIKHQLNNEKDEDIKFLFSPSQLKTNANDSRTILHIDSNRWYSND